MQDPNWEHSAIPPLTGPWVLFCPCRDFFCLYTRPDGWDVLGCVEKPQHRGWLSFLWELLSHWGPRLQLHGSCVCACSLALLTQNLTHSPTLCLHLGSGLSSWTCWELTRWGLSLVTISRTDSHPQLLVSIPDSLPARAQPCFLVVPLSFWLGCSRWAACPHCSPTHRLPTGQFYSSGELLRTLI